MTPDELLRLYFAQQGADPAGTGGDPRLSPYAQGGSAATAIALPGITATARRETTGPAARTAAMYAPLSDVLSRSQPPPSRLFERLRQGTADNPIHAAPMYARPPDGVPPELAKLVASPYVRDTLLPMVTGGGRPPLPIRWSEKAPDKQTAAWYFPRGPNRPSDAITMFDVHARPEMEQSYLNHEVGHAFDFRGIDPAMVKHVQEGYAHARHEAPHQYGAKDPTEYFAEVFRKSMDLLHWSPEDRGYVSVADWRSDVDAADHQLPGVKALVQDMLNRPENAHHWTKTHPNWYMPPDSTIQ